VNLKGGKEGKSQPLISMDLLLYQSHFLEVMIEKIREVVQNFLRGTRRRSLLQGSSALGTEWSTAWAIPKRLRISPKDNTSKAPKARMEGIPRRNRGMIHTNAHGQDISLLVQKDQ
jgi:hypothetical protein